MSDKKVISIAAGCWNEKENIPLFYERCRAELARHPEYDYVGSSEKLFFAEQSVF